VTAEQKTWSQPQQVAHDVCACGRPAANGAPLRSAAREAIARRAYEISLDPDGGTSAQNWLRAERELHGQYGRYP
jgi:hypothetical protein